MSGPKPDTFSGLTPVEDPKPENSQVSRQHASVVLGHLAEHYRTRAEAMMRTSFHLDELARSAAFLPNDAELALYKLAVDGFNR